MDWGHVANTVRNSRTPHSNCSTVAYWVRPLVSMMISWTKLVASLFIDVSRLVYWVSSNPWNDSFAECLDFSTSAFHHGCISGWRIIKSELYDVSQSLVVPPKSDIFEKGDYGCLGGFWHPLNLTWSEFDPWMRKLPDWVCHQGIQYLQPSISSQIFVLWVTEVIAEVLAEVGMGYGEWVSKLISPAWVTVVVEATWL